MNSDRLTLNRKTQMRRFLVAEAEHTLSPTQHPGSGSARFGLRAASRGNWPVRRHAALLLTAGVAVGVVGTGGAVWALNGFKSPSPPSAAGAPTFPAYYDQFAPIGGAVAAIQGEFTDVYAGFWFDAKTITLHVGYYEGADPARVTQYLSKIAAINSDPPLTVAASAVGFDYKARAELAEDIGTNEQKWSDYFGREFTGVSFDETTGDIHVLVSTEQAPMHSTAPDGTPITFEVVTVELQ